MIKRTVANELRDYMSDTIHELACDVEADYSSANKLSEKESEQIFKLALRESEKVYKEIIKNLRKKGAK